MKYYSCIEVISSCNRLSGSQHWRTKEGVRGESHILRNRVPTWLTLVSRPYVGKPNLRRKHRDLYSNLFKLAIKCLSAVNLTLFVSVCTRPVKLPQRSSSHSRKKDPRFTKWGFRSIEPHVFSVPNYSKYYPWSTLQFPSLHAELSIPDPVLRKHISSESELPSGTWKIEVGWFNK